MRSGNRLKTLAPDIGQRAFLQEKRSPEIGLFQLPQRDRNPRQPPAWLWAGLDLFPEFLAGGVVVDPGIVGRPDDGNHLGNAA